MNLYCIHGGFYKGIAERLKSFKSACMARDITCVVIDGKTADYAELPKLDKFDMLYNVGRGGETLESLLIRQEAITFYVNNPPIVENNGDTIKYSLIHDKIGIPAPRTIFQVSGDKKQLKRSVEILGGFPVVLKTKGGTGGIGTMRLNDFPSLFSVVDYLRDSQVEFILREYVIPKEVARLTVIGNQVVIANQKIVAKDDFRTSVTDQPIIRKKYPLELDQLAIKAAHSANFENCGVDIIIDKNDQPFVLEVNMPHDFTTTEKVFGIDLAGMMVDHLIDKYNRKHK